MGEGTFPVLTDNVFFVPEQKGNFQNNESQFLPEVILV